jgi:hypothetical protein
VTHLKELVGAGAVYPHKFHVSTSITDFIERYSYLGNEQVSDDKLSIAG